MSGSAAAAIVTAFASTLTALGGLVLAFAVLLPILRRTRSTENKVDRQVDALAQVHTMVNQQRTDAQRYQDALIRALNAAGVDVPIDQSLGPALPQSEAA